MRSSREFCQRSSIELPIDELHWDARITADTVETWSGPFEHFEIAANTVLGDSRTTGGTSSTVSAAWKFRYRYDPNTLTIDSGEFETPSSRGTLDGVLAPRNSVMNLRFETGALETYKISLTNCVALRRAPRRLRNKYQGAYGGMARFSARGRAYVPRTSAWRARAVRRRLRRFPRG